MSTPVDVVVVGGGIVGAATAYYLNQFGIACKLIERDAIAAHASGMALGGLHPRLVGAEDSAMSLFAVESFELHKTLHEELEHQSGTSTWRPRLSIALAETEQQANTLTAGLSMSKSDAAWLDAVDLQKLDERLNPDLHGGTLTTQSADVDSEALTKSLVLNSSCEVLEGEVASINVKDDRVLSVQLKDASKITGDTFVFAMGPWCVTVLEWCGLVNVLKPLKGQILRLDIKGPPFEHTYSVAENYMSSKVDGLTWVGTTEEDTQFDVSRTVAARETIVRTLKTIASRAQVTSIVRHTACLRPLSMDGELILGGLPKLTNAYVGTGAGRKGMLYGPLMGKTIAASILSSDDSLFPREFSPSRFLS